MFGSLLFSYGGLTHSYMKISKMWVLYMQNPLLLRSRYCVCEKNVVTLHRF